MAFKIGNFAIKEIISGIGTNFNDEILFVLDQLQNASVEISSDPTEITDKRGNVIRQIYQNKSGTFTSTSALLSPALAAIQTGKEIEYASQDSPLKAPKVMTVAAGSVVDVADSIEGTIHVMGLYNNGANGVNLTQGASAVVDKTFAYDSANKTVTVPGSTTGAPDMYVIKYDRNITSGLKIANDANSFPNTMKLYLYVAIMDPCSDVYKCGILELPSFQPDPSTTLSLDSESQTVDFGGTLQVSYCDCDKSLYRLYLIDEDAVITAGCNE